MVYVKQTHKQTKKKHNRTEHLNLMTPLDKFQNHLWVLKNANVYVKNVQKFLEHGSETDAIQ